MAKKVDINDSNDIDYVTTEITKLSPQKGDIFILNVHTDDPDVLYSEEILESLQVLSETLEEHTGLKIPILLFGDEIDLSLLSKDDLLDLIDKLEQLEQQIEDDEDDDEDEIDTEHLTDQFN